MVLSKRCIRTEPVRWGGVAVALWCLACGDDAAPAPDAGEQEPASEWTIVAEDLAGALFSVTGRSARDVWVAGSDRGDGRGPILAHWNGKSWSTEDTGVEAADLLWVAIVADEVFTVGSRGTVLRGDESGFERLEAPTEQALWGVWGETTDDVWAVGGEASGGRGVVLRYDGNEWLNVEWTELGEELPTPSAWYKVWGVSADDVWFCGTEGALMHWDGAGFTVVDSDTTRTLLTIHGRDDGSLITAVGGQFTATLTQARDGGPFRDVTPDDAPLQMLGVHHAGDVAYAVGLDSYVMRNDDGGDWELEETGLLVYQSLHGVWLDPQGGVWAAGGQVQSEPYEYGQLVYKGEAPPKRFGD